MNNLPAELLRLRRWVNYIPGKKIPMSRGQAAFRSGTNRRDSWSTFQQVRNLDRYHLGLDIETPYIGVDLDKVIEDSGKLTARGHELLSQLPDTYMEFSPSASGLHLWYRVPQYQHSKLPNSAVGDHIEVYSRLRWFTFTSRPANGINKITRLKLEEALAIFALGKVQRAAKKRSVKAAPGLWDREALEHFLMQCNVEYRAHKDDTLRVRCPGTLGWPDKVRHDDDGLKGNATTILLSNGTPLFYCHHAKCAGRDWPEFRRFHDPQSKFSLERFINERFRRTHGKG